MVISFLAIDLIQIDAEPDGGQGGHDVAGVADGQLEHCLFLSGDDCCLSDANSIAHGGSESSAICTESSASCSCAANRPYHDTNKQALQSFDVSLACIYIW